MDGKLYSTGVGVHRPRVIIESPYAGRDPWGRFCPGLTAANEVYARLAMADALKRGEDPYASHLLYTQPGVLDDTVPEERELGMNAGWNWMAVADGVVAYVDLGVSPGMERGLHRAGVIGKPTAETRRLADLPPGLAAWPDNDPFPMLNLPPRPWTTVWWNSEPWTVVPFRWTSTQCVLRAAASGVDDRVWTMRSRRKNEAGLLSPLHIVPAVDCAAPWDSSWESVSVNLDPAKRRWYIRTDRAQANAVTPWAPVEVNP